jgi:Uma2 family endonuclease
LRRPNHPWTATTADSHPARRRYRCASTDPSKRREAALPSSQTTAKILDFHRYIFSYPDILVICGDPLYSDDQKDIVLNPTAIAEVLSASTEAFDRGEKFNRYQEWNPSLADYLLISQDQPQIEHFSRQPDGSWNYRRYTGLDAVVVIPSIHCTLKLADVYDRIEFK